MAGSKLNSLYGFQVIGEEQPGMEMLLPEPTQGLQGSVGQGNQTILMTFAPADMSTLLSGKPFI